MSAQPPIRSHSLGDLVDLVDLVDRVTISAISPNWQHSQNWALVEELEVQVAQVEGVACCTTALCVQGACSILLRMWMWIRKGRHLGCVRQRWQKCSSWMARGKVRGRAIALVAHSDWRVTSMALQQQQARDRATPVHVCCLRWWREGARLH